MIDKCHGASGVKALDELLKDLTLSATTSMIIVIQPQDFRERRVRGHDVSIP